MFGLFKNKKTSVADLRAGFESVEHRASEVMNTLELHSFSNALEDYPNKKGVEFQNPSSQSSSAWLKLAKELNTDAQSVLEIAKSADEVEMHAQVALSVALEYLALRAAANGDNSADAAALRAEMDRFETETANISKKLGTEPLSRRT